MEKTSETIYVKNWVVGLAVGLVALLIGLLGFRVLFVNFVDNYEMAYKFDTRSGQIKILTEGSDWQHGYIVTPPLLVKVHTVDLRPMQVCMNANQRVLNCKLIRFDPAGLHLFLEWHGRSDYDGPSGTANEESKFSDILKSYAFDGSGKGYPFLIVLRELKPEEVQK